MVKWETMWEGPDSQEVGLEAAILERVRNSSLVDGAVAPTIHRG